MRNHKAYFPDLWPARYCNIVPDDQLWCVTGSMLDENGKISGAGVILWCYDEEDAECWIDEFRSHIGCCYEDLDVMPWLSRPDRKGFTSN